MSYTQVSADYSHTVLLRSDGKAVACGGNFSGQCNIPALEVGTSYISDPTLDRALVLQMDLNDSSDDDSVTVVCSSLAGEEQLRFQADVTDSAWETHKRIAIKSHVRLHCLRVVLPDGQLLGKVCYANPGVTLAGVTQSCKRRRLT
eukprot:Skav220739  [mRNA]  locus=scaffold2753:325557:325994:- [translate_table: standard]